MSNGTRSVIGVFRTPTGVVFPNKTLTWFRAQRKTTSQAGSVIVDQPFLVTTDASGTISTNVLPGDYLVLVPLKDQDRYFQVGIPEGSEPFDVADGIETTAPPVTPEVVLLARAARDEARRWASENEDVVVEGEEFSAKHYSLKAGSFASAAEESETKARLWAEEAEDVPVDPDKFSAKHWAVKAAEAAASVGDPAPQTRKINTGTGLTGGGDLSQDRTISAAIATQSQAESGSDNTKLMTPLRVKQAIDASLLNSAQPTFYGFALSGDGTELIQTSARDQHFNIKDFDTHFIGDLGYGWAYRVLDAQYIRTRRFPFAPGSSSKRSV